ncbi:MAG: hypothetical protein KDJ75_08400 [Alphaproteobacteria bacterium]|nr:hypothetical protein [Alphaproteobacteria bacterium]
MAAIAGSSQYLNASALANVRGVAPSTPTLLSQSNSALSLLDSGRNLSAGRFGLSSSARVLNQQFLNNSASINQMFSLGVGADATIEGAQQQILALRAGMSDSQLAPFLRAKDDGSVSASGTGRSVDTEA